MTVDDVEVPIHRTGDAAYPVKKWLMKGFTHHHCLTPEQNNFNYHLNSSRMEVKNAFGHLKGHWCLAKRKDVDISTMPDIVAACCILHNVCEINKENFLAEWNIDAGTFMHPRQVALHGYKR
eukprot:superscaffoldBa00000269_g3354